VALRRFDEAEAEMMAVLEIDPAHRFALANLGHLMYRRGAYDEAVELYRGIYDQSHQSEQIQSDVYDSLCLALALQGAGRSDEARSILEQELDDLRARTTTASSRGTDPSREACLLAALGRGRDARDRALELEPLVVDDPAGLFILAEAFALVGETDKAVEFLERAVEIGFNDPYYILVNPPMRGLQDRPEMEELAPF
jgi:tetratricopeptide (TPR) repeat protein